jgi:uroporphyrinogen decarboxylase
MILDMYGNNAQEVTPYERVAAALNGEKTDRVPVNYYPRWAALEYLGVTFKQAWDDPDLYVKAQILAQERLQYDVIIDYDMMGPVEEAIGAELKYPENDVPQIVGSFIKTKEDMKKAKWKLDPRKDGNMPKVLYAIRQMKEELIKRGRGTQQVPIWTWGSCPSRTAACLTGFKEWFLIVARDPDWAMELMEKCMDGWLQMVIAAWEAGADAVWINDPVSARDCISREHYEKLTQPFERKFIEAIRKNTGMKITMHPCGNWHDRMDLVYQNQADAYFLGPMDIKMCTDVAVENNAKGLSRVTMLNGGVGAATPDTTDGQTKCDYATTMKRGTPAQVEENSRVVIETVENADLRCMLGTNCWDVKGAPVVNRDAMVYAARKYGQYK